MKIVLRHGKSGSRQSWHDKAWERGDSALGAHTTRHGHALDKVLRTEQGLSRHEVGAQQGFFVAIESSLSR